MCKNKKQEYSLTHTNYGVKIKKIQYSSNYIPSTDQLRAPSIYETKPEQAIHPLRNLRT